MIARGVRLLRFKCFILLMLFFCCCPLKRRKTSGLSLAGRPCVFFCALLGTRRRRFTLLLLLLHLLRSREITHKSACPASHFLHTSPERRRSTNSLPLSESATTLSRARITASPVVELPTTRTNQQHFFFLHRAGSQTLSTFRSWLAAGGKILRASAFLVELHFT